jgi:hypothetical protein
MRTGMGPMFRELYRWEVGGTSGMVTDNSETFRLDNLESEMVGGACSKRVNLVHYTMESRQRLYEASYPIMVH